MMKGAGSVDFEGLKEACRELDRRAAARKRSRVSNAPDTGVSEGVSTEKYGGWHNIGEEEVNGGNEA